MLAKVIPQETLKSYAWKKPNNFTKSQAIIETVVQTIVKKIEPKNFLKIFAKIEPNIFPKFVLKSSKNRWREHFWFMKL